MDASCTVNRTVAYIAKKWTLIIILEIYKGENRTRRFSELMDRLPGITQKVLAERLRELVHEGLVENRVDAHTFPVKSEYILTESGEEIVMIIKSLKHWALKWKIVNAECRGTDCASCVL